MSPKAQNDGAMNGTNSAIGKAFAVLRALRDANGPMTLTAVADQVGVAPSSAHSILSHLLRESVVVQVQDKRYELGPQLFYLGAGFARGTPIYRSTWMEMIAAAGQFSVTAAVAVKWDDSYLVLNSHRAGRSDVAIPFGGRVPLDASSWAKVYFAWSGAPLPKKLTAYTDLSIVDAGAFAKEVESVRRVGYATDRGEFSDGVGGVCAPVTSTAGFEGVASFVAPLSEIGEDDFDRLGRALMAITSRASMALGDQDRVKFFGTV